MKLSFLRANFCSELMNYTQKVPVTKGEAYLMGMFSTLNYLVDAPMEEILGEVPISNEIKMALLNQEGPCGALYGLVLSYEHADWSKVTKYSEELEIPANLLTSLYFDCMEQANMVWKDMNAQ